MTLLCIISGMEHSGTTLFSQLFNGHPLIKSGVECGLLLSEISDFHTYEPFYTFLGTNKDWFWNISAEGRDRILQCANYNEAYKTLSYEKGRAHPNPMLRKMFIEADFIFDKTPRYVYDLANTMSKMPVPFLITLKSPAEQYLSWKKRGLIRNPKKRGLIRNLLKRGLIRNLLKNDVEEFSHRYNLVIDNINDAKKLFPHNLMVIRYKTLTNHLPDVMQKVAHFLGLPSIGNLTLEVYNRSFGLETSARNTFDNRELFYSEPKLFLNHIELEKLEELEVAFRKINDDGT